MTTLYQFRFSHYCEKARWALDYKGIVFDTRNLLPGLHIRTAKKLADDSCLPILVDQGSVIQDSTAIIDYLDRTYPQKPLTPSDPKQARRALDWEEFADEKIGVPLRLWFYFHTLSDRRRARDFLLQGSPWYGYVLFPLVFSRVRSAMCASMNIHAVSAEQAKQQFVAALDRLDQVVATQRFLVGDRFSRADLSVCALLAPYCASGKTEQETERAYPPAVYALRMQHKERPFFEWVQENYRSMRIRQA